MAQLTDQEKQEILRYIEAGKPLPDKYRFLLFDEKREVELVWNGKTNEVCNIVLPFQTIEHVDEPRSEKAVPLQMGMFDTDSRGRQLKGWTNKLIWGDNKLILSSLKNGPLREEIEAQGGLKLIYIDPPFDVGADFSMDIEIGGDTFTKRPNVLEEIAYRDTWGKGADSFISMIYERLILMRDLLAEEGSIYVHMGPNVSHIVRCVLDEVFGRESFKNEIAWKRSDSHNDPNKYGVINDSILYYTKSDKWIWSADKENIALSESTASNWYNNEEIADIDIVNRLGMVIKQGTKRYFNKADISAPAHGSNANQDQWHGALPPPGRMWAYKLEYRQQLEAENRIVFSKNGKPYEKRYLDESKGTPPQSIWSDIQMLRGMSKHHEKSEWFGYSTQKPERLIERIINISSNEGDLVADFFCGSGTTAAVAEKLGRKWIVTDLGKFAIHTTRKRMIGVQRQLKTDGKPYRAFEILNLGRYERQYYIGVNPDLREEERQKQLAEKESAFVALILRAYQAQSTTGFRAFQGKKTGRLVAVGPVNMPVTRLYVEEIILECRQKHITKVDILAFEFEMGLFPNVQEDAKSKGIDLALKYIPAEVFDKRAVEKNQVVFHDVAFLEAKVHFTPPLAPPHAGGKPRAGGSKGGPTGVAVELTDFSVFYSQDSIKNAETTLKDGASKIVVDKGRIVKVIKDKKGIVTRETLTTHWTDWIDYWAVDFDFESKREIIRVKTVLEGQNTLEGLEPGQAELKEWKEVWTGDYVFENEWQSFRTKKDRTLELTSIFHECPPGKRKIALKVVDIFGNDTMKIIEVKV